MRVISGKFKGRKLEMLKNTKIRPTSDRMKEAVFSIIDSEKYSGCLKNKNFLDLFSGSGSIGIEAFSRGAKYVYMIDNNDNSIKLIVKNIKKLGLNQQEESGFVLKKHNIFLINNLNLPIFDFIYIDPPYKTNKYEKILNILLKNKIINDKSLIFLETDLNEKYFHTQYINIKNKKFSKSFLNILKLIN